MSGLLNKPRPVWQHALAAAALVGVGYWLGRR